MKNRSLLGLGLWRFCCGLAFILSLSFSQAGRAQVLAPLDPAKSAGGIHLSHRHIMILNADLENIWGSYFFAVQNNTQQTLNFKTKVMLPKEAVDFRPQDGLSETDLKLAEDGTLMLEKEFPPGLSLVGVGFQVKVRSWGQDVLSLAPPVTLDELSIAVPKRSGLKVQAETLQAGVPPMLGGGQYDGIMSQAPVQPGQKLEVVLQGVPKQRVYFWGIGGVVALLFMTLASILTMKTRTLSQREQAEELTV